LSLVFVLTTASARTWAVLSLTSLRRHASSLQSWRAEPARTPVRER